MVTLLTQTSTYSAPHTHSDQPEGSQHHMYVLHIYTYANMSLLYNSTEKPMHMAHYTCATHCTQEEQYGIV